MPKANYPHRLRFLDSLRGWAIILVVVVHSGAVAELFGSRLAIANLGQRGVQLFYEVSAFSLLYAWREAPGPWSAFFIRRFFRIAPLFYLSMLASFVITVIIQHQRALSPGTYLEGATFLFGFSPSTINAVAPAAWSIAVETTFYALFPMVVFLVRDLESAIALACVAVPFSFAVSYGNMGAALGGFPGEYRHFLWFPVEFPVFCFGVVAYFAWEKVRGRIALSPPVAKRLSITRRGVSAALLAAGVATLGYAYPVANELLYAESLGIAFILLAMAVHPWALLVNPVASGIGQLSYGIYLVHSFLAPIASRFLEYCYRSQGLNLYGRWTGLIGVFLVLMSISAVISYSLHRIIEQPAIGLGRRLSNMSKKRINSTNESPAIVESGSTIPGESTGSTFRRYILWLASIVGAAAFSFEYARQQSSVSPRTEKAYENKISLQQKQLEAVSAALLSTQRDLLNAQRDLERCNSDYGKAVEEIRRLQTQAK